MVLSRFFARLLQSAVLGVALVASSLQAQLTLGTPQANLSPAGYGVVHFAKKHKTGLICIAATCGTSVLAYKAFPTYRSKIARWFGIKKKGSNTSSITQNTDKEPNTTSSSSDPQPISSNESQPQSPIATQPTQAETKEQSAQPTQHELYRFIFQEYTLTKDDQNQILTFEMRDTRSEEEIKAFFNTLTQLHATYKKEYVSTQSSSYWKWSFKDFNSFRKQLSELYNSPAFQYIIDTMLGKRMVYNFLSTQNRNSKGPNKQQQKFITLFKNTQFEKFANACHLLKIWNEAADANDKTHTAEDTYTKISKQLFEFDLPQILIPIAAE